MLLGGGLVALAIGALVVALIVYALKGSGTSREEKVSSTSNTTARPQLTEEQNKLLTSGKKTVSEIRNRLAAVQDPGIRESGSSICSTCDKIFKTLAEQPKSITAARQFLTYYLPTINLVLEKYLKVEKSGTDSGKMTVKVSNYLKDINKALDTFYTKLFEDDKLDLTVEMEAMTMAVKRDGLITDNELMQELNSAGGLEDINLSL